MSETVTTKRIKVIYEGEVKPLQQAEKQAETTLQGFTKSLNKTSAFASKLGKILEYRLIRGGLSKILQGLEDGKKAIEAYDKSLNGLSASKAATYMQEMNENTTLLQNTLASLFMTVYASVQPAINTLVDLLRDAMNAINQVLSALMGRDSYTKAVKGFNSVTESAKALKKQIFGFDELNILNSPSGSDDTDYSGAFEETELQGIFASISEAMKKVNTVIDWGLIQRSAIAVGAAIAAWSVSSKLFEFVNAIKGNPMFNIVVGATLMVAGIQGLYEALENAIANGLSAENVSEMFLSSAALIIGGYMVGKTLGNAVLGGTVGALLVGGTMLWYGLYGALTDGISPAAAFLITAGTGIIGAVFASLSGVMSVGVGGLTGIAIGAAVALGLYLYQHWDEISTKLSNWFTSVGQTVDGALADLRIKAADAYFKLYDKFPGWLQTFLDALGVFRKNAIENELTPLANAIKNVLSLFSKLNSTSAMSTGIASVGKVLGFANGGYPTTGDLFIANESGPELVGQFGTRTGVYNQDQFAAGMAAANQAVVQAVYAIGAQISNSVDSKPVPSVKIGDRDIYSASQRGATLKGQTLIQGAR